MQRPCFAYPTKMGTQSSNPEASTLEATAIRQALLRYWSNLNWAEPKHNP
jgi:hypothetical protein